MSTKRTSSKTSTRTTNVPVETRAAAPKQSRSKSQTTEPEVAAPVREKTLRSKSHKAPKEEPVVERERSKSRKATTEPVESPAPVDSPSKPKRAHNTKPTLLDQAGIGIGPAKAKKILMFNSFNPVEHAVRQALINAENKPVRPKPTEGVPDPKVPEQGAQTPIDQLPADLLAVIRAAEAEHQRGLEDEYTAFLLSKPSTKEDANHDFDGSKFSDDRVKAYHAALATRVANVDMHAFRVGFDAKFFDGFENWRQANDSYALNRVVTAKDGSESLRYNQWTRAMALVNKSCVRVSSGVRDILACYLDSIVLQYATNGIENCVTDGQSNLKLHHAIRAGPSFGDRVPMDGFVRTLPGYRAAVQWLDDCKSAKEAHAVARKAAKEAGTVVAEKNYVQPAYPDAKYDENLEGYVVEICRSARMRLATETPEKANDYHNIKVGDDFKKFCSTIVYECILRIGAHLKEVVALKDVKTVNDVLMYHTLRQISNVCGVDFAPIQSDMEARLARYDTWCKTRRLQRKANRGTKVDEDSDADVDVAYSSE